MAAVFFWNAINTPKKIFITWNPIAGTSQIKDEEDDRFGARGDNHLSKVDVDTITSGMVHVVGDGFP